MGHCERVTMPHNFLTDSRVQVHGFMIDQLVSRAGYFADDGNGGLPSWAKFRKSF